MLKSLVQFVCEHMSFSHIHMNRLEKMLQLGRH